MDEKWATVDRELSAGLAAVRHTVPLEVTADRILALRRTTGGRRSLADVTAGREIEGATRTIPTHDGGGIEVTVLRRRGSAAPGPGILHLHGGGMIFGNRFDDIDQPLDWVERHGAVCVAVEYRLAPEFPDPHPVEDAFAALTWVAAHAAALGIDTGRLMLFGASAGGGLAAGTALLARERGGPMLLGQMLVYPMLDDRDATASTQRFAVGGTWDRISNRTAWTALLGARRGGASVSAAAAPARAERLDGLPKTYLDCGSVDLFLDEDLAYAQRLRRDGVPVELRIWRGAFHAFDDLVPDAHITRLAKAARDRWVAALLE